MTKTNMGRFFEDYTVGETIRHAVPRTVGEGERALHTALYPTRFPLSSSDEFARICGLTQSPLDELLGFHVVFGKTVPDVSLNAVANLGYAEVRFKEPIWPGDTLTTLSEVIGLKQNSNGKTGVVWVRSSGRNQYDREVISYCRWVMVRKRDPESPAPETVVPDLAPFVSPEDLSWPTAIDLSAYDRALAGSAFGWEDYQIGERIDHVDGVTISEAEHMMATRLWQNTAKVHFDATHRDDGRRLIYGGHVISMARALSYNGLGNAALVLAINAGAHANPCFAEDTVFAWSEVLDKVDIPVPGAAAMRLRLVATKAPASDFPLRNSDGKYMSNVLLDLDYWALVPRS